MVSLNEIEVLIHYYVSSAKHEREDAGAVQSAIQRFIVEDMMVAVPEAANGYKVTPRGEAWLRMLKNVQFPTQAWVDESGRVV